MITNFFSENQVENIVQLKSCHPMGL